MDYKKIFKTRESRKLVLKLLSFIPDKTMLELQYRIKSGRKLNLKDPQRFTEKIQWYKLYYHNPVMKQCVNKHAVREYVKSKGLESILVTQYAHYDRAEDIEWAKLPDRFVVKTQHGGGGLSVILCKDRNSMSKQEIVDTLGFSNSTSPAHRGGREWAYWGNPTGIVVEELLENRENPEAGINDYKIFCFNGKAEYVIVDVDRYIGHKRNVYDRDWNKIDVATDCPGADREIQKPDNLPEMFAVAEKLSEDFPFVRVDLYSVEDKVYFGELTFYPWSGYVNFVPESFDFELGKDFPLVRYAEK